MSIEVAVIPLAALAIPIVVAPVAIIAKTVSRHREMEHKERIRAIELGRVLPKDESWWSRGRISAMIGAGVPVIAMFLAWMASESMGGREEVWITATVIGVTSVICGTRLATKLPAPDPMILNAKHDMDPDAYDVVSRRG